MCGKTTAFFALMMAALTIGCSTSAASRGDHSILLTLEGREHTIVVTTGPDGPRYSMQTSVGELPFADLAMEELRTRHPEIYERLNTAIAAQDASIN